MSEPLGDKNIRNRPRWLEAAANDHCIENGIAAFTYRDTAIMLAIHERYQGYRGSYMSDVQQAIKLKNVAEALVNSALFKTKLVRRKGGIATYRHFTYLGFETGEVYSEFYTKSVLETYPIGEFDYVEGREDAEDTSTTSG